MKNYNVLVQLCAVLCLFKSAECQSPQPPLPPPPSLTGDLHDHRSNHIVKEVPPMLHPAASQLDPQFVNPVIHAINNQMLNQVHLSESDLSQPYANDDFSYVPYNTFGAAP